MDPRSLTYELHVRLPAIFPISPIDHFFDVHPPPAAALTLRALAGIVSGSGPPSRDRPLVNVIKTPDAEVTAEAGARRHR